MSYFLRPQIIDKKMTESNYNDNQELEKGPGLVCKTNFKIV